MDIGSRARGFEYAFHYSVLGAVSFGMKEANPLAIGRWVNVNDDRIHSDCVHGDVLKVVPLYGIYSNG